ncbi:MAG: deoxyribodipyrimidine photo-lyase [Taibaiella sp.]|jgi:deoxyribodipyrimidine photo-lyase
MKISIFWFRRDLRLEDNAGLYYALKGEYPVLPVFIFDTEILEELEDKKDARVQFIHDTLTDIQEELQQWNSSIHVYHDAPLKAFQQIICDYNVAQVYTNQDYEPYAIKRDQKIEALLRTKNISFNSFKDQVIFDQNEVAKDNNEPYTVYTPFSKKWKSLLEDFHLKPYPTLKYKNNFYQNNIIHFPALGALGFEKPSISIPPKKINADLIKAYDRTRDNPSIEGTTRLGIHLRFGTISIRKLVAIARELNETFLNELIWREFFMAIIWHFPKVINTSFREEYDHIKWRNNEQEFEQWCAGKTGYPIVDAGMRQMNTTGFMHNRIRMITASFLTKHLLIDWRWGEAYFGKKLLDYDLSANNGNWQWAAGCGCDAAPYFRIFSPQRQTEKFDPQLKYIKKWVPELGTDEYPQPIVDHTFARERCLAIYKHAVNAKY